MTVRVQSKAGGETRNNNMVKAKGKKATMVKDVVGKVRYIFKSPSKSTY